MNTSRATFSISWISTHLGERRWEIGVALLSATLYLWNLSANGFANTYYSAAAWAGSQDWTAWIFGSLDPHNFITTDKPPLSIMASALSIRLFGLSPFSVLFPHALMGVATVWILMATVRRTFGRGASILSGLVLALTPVAALVFRYNNPDSLLTLLLTASAYCVVRGQPSAQIRWLLAASALIGCAFNTKLLQSYVVLPAVIFAVAVSWPGSVRARILVLVASGASLVVSSSWWIALSELAPTSMRPFIDSGGSDSALRLALGTNGIGRILFSGASSDADQILEATRRFVGEPGALRMFNEQFAGQASWLLPVAFGALAAGIAMHRRATRTNPQLFGLFLWGGWLLVHIVLLSFMRGTARSYYAISFAPALAALVGYGLTVLIAEGPAWYRRCLFPALAIVTVTLAAVISWRTPEFVPWFGTAAAVATTVVLAMRLREDKSTARKRWSTVFLISFLLATPTLHTLATVATSYSGGRVSAGPGFDPTLFPARGTPASGIACLPIPPLTPEAVRVIRMSAAEHRWAVGVCGSLNAAELELAHQVPVAAFGGYFGKGGPPSEVQLQELLSSHSVRYFVFATTSSQRSDVTEAEQWVVDHCALTPIEVGDFGLFDCHGVATP
jgi:4-amino-4-deoxy-L-arabinose transferase-like glycosyltransferase